MFNRFLKWLTGEDAQVETWAVNRRDTSLVVTEGKKESSLWISFSQEILLGRNHNHVAS